MMTEKWIYPLAVETPTRDLFVRVVTIAHAHAVESFGLENFLTHWDRYKEDTCVLIDRSNRLKYGPKKYFNSYEGDTPRLSAPQFLAYYEGMGLLPRPALPKRGGEQL